MLKITYTENGFYLEHLTETLETWLAKRVLLCLRAATSIYAEPSTASFLLPEDAPYLEQLKTLHNSEGEIIELVANEDNFLEVSLQGTWVTAEENSEEGVFVCTLSDRTESFLYQIWQEANIGTTLVSE
ncbi:MAG TPA: alr0857 family protein [Xenococcaceae cyanobacterium]